MTKNENDNNCIFKSLKSLDDFVNLFEIDFFFDYSSERFDEMRENFDKSSIKITKVYKVLNFL